MHDKLLSVCKTITDIKIRQERIKIDGAEWYDNGYWRIRIYDIFNEIQFKYVIKDTDRDYTFMEFLIEGINKYKEHKNNQKH